MIEEKAGVLIALDPDKIRANLKTRYIGRKVIVYKSTASTNDIAAEYAKNKANNGLVVLAEEQRGGRGRGGNKWVSGFGQSVLCSILLTDTTAGRVAVPFDSAQGRPATAKQIQHGQDGRATSGLSVELLPLAIAVATSEAIGKCAKAEAKIKWPNDIILNNKKVAGILVESRKHGKYTANVIGIGINCHQQKTDFPGELRRTATSIDIETGASADRISLIKRLLVSVEHWLETAEKKPQKVIDRWQTLSTQLNHRVTVIYNRKRFAGNCIGIDPQEGLILQLDTGGLRMFHAAQTTIMKD